MRKWIYILILALCSVICEQGQAFASECSEISREEVLANHYSEQLECAHKYNNFATRSHSISIPTTNSSTSATREQVRLLADTALPSIAAGAIYAVNHSVYRICSRRVIDYYLYTLCCLRLWYPNWLFDSVLTLFTNNTKNRWTKQSFTRHFTLRATMW